MNYGYCRKARSSWRGNIARRERPARTPETLNSLLETPAPGEPCRRRRPHARGGPENKGPREETSSIKKPISADPTSLPLAYSFF